jgi:hypothetical protein
MANKQTKTRNSSMNVPDSRKQGRMVNPSGQLNVGKTNKPLIQNLSNGDIRIRNTELLSVLTTNATGPAAYRQNIPLNPASSNQFGWLAPIAKNFNKYRFDNLVVSFVSRVATTRDGTVALGVFYDYESSQSWLTNSTTIGTALTNLSYCSEYGSGAIYSGGCIGDVKSSDWMGVKPKTGPGSRRMNWFTIDPDPASTPTEQISRFNICVQNFLGLVNDFALNNSTTGYLYVTYDIVLSECSPPFVGVPSLMNKVESASPGPFDPVPFPPTPPIPDDEAGGEEEP